MQDQDVLTELFARTTVLQSRAVILLQRLDQADVSIDEIRDSVLKLYERTSVVVHLVYELVGVDPVVLVRGATYQPVPGNADSKG